MSLSICIPLFSFVICEKSWFINHLQFGYMAIYHSYHYYPFTLELKINPIYSICYAFLAISVVKNLVELNHIPSSSIVLWLAIEFTF